MFKFALQTPVLGVPVAIKTSSEAVYALAENRFGRWRGLSPCLTRAEPPLTVTVHESTKLTNSEGIGQLDYKVESGQVAATGCGVDFFADRQKGLAEAQVDRRVIAATDFFLDNILACMVLFLATRKDRIPLHASLMVCNNTGLLLSGGSGSGKSTLSYQLYRRGAAPVAESAVYIASEGGVRLWGDIRKFNLRPDTRRLFPELMTKPAAGIAGGETRIQVYLPAAEEATKPLFSFAGRFVLIILERHGNDHSEFIEISHEQAAARLAAERESGFALAAEFEQAIMSLPLSSCYFLASGNDLLHQAETMEKL